MEVNPVNLDTATPAQLAAKLRAATGRERTPDELAAYLDPDSAPSRIAFDRLMARIESEADLEDGMPEPQWSNKP